MRTVDPVKIQRIIEAAADLFAERHYHEVRMDDIATRAGVAKGTIYLHFKDKDALYQALVLDSLEKLSRWIREGLVGLDDPVKKLVSMTREVIRYFQHHAFTLDLIHRVERLQEQGGASDEAFARVYADFKTIVLSILGEFPEAASESEEDLALAVLAHSGMIKEVLQKLPHPWPDDLPERLTHFFLRGFLRTAKCSGLDQVHEIPQCDKSINY